MVKSFGSVHELLTRYQRLHGCIQRSRWVASEEFGQLVRRSRFSKGSTNGSGRRSFAEVPGSRGRPDCDSVFELCTSDGFSGPTRHFRPLKRLQLTHSAIVVFIVVRAHAGEPPFVLNRLQISVYELCTDGKLTSSFGLFSFCRAVIRSKPEHGIEFDFQVLPQRRAK